MNSKQRSISKYMLDHMVDVGYMSLKELATQAKVSEVSILNFCNLLGYDSFVAMREAFRDYVRECMPAAFMPTMYDEEQSILPPEQKNKFYQFATEVADSFNQMTRNIDIRKMDQCARTILVAKHVVVFGHDISKLAADYLTSRLNYMRIRTQTINLGDEDMVINTLAGLTHQDCVIFFSFHPYYSPSGDVANYVRRCGATVIAITDGIESPVVTDDTFNFICKVQNSVYFNVHSVPLHFAELLGCYVSLLLGERLDHIIRDFNKIGDYLAHKEIGTNEDGENVE